MTYRLKAPYCAYYFCAPAFLAEGSGPAVFYGCTRTTTQVIEAHHTAERIGRLHQREVASELANEPSNGGMGLSLGEYRYVRLGREIRWAAFWY